MSASELTLRFSVTARRQLKFAVLWQSIGWCLVSAVIALSLSPHLPALPHLLGWDKLQHLGVYGCLMGWFGQAFASRWIWPLFLTAMGIGLEFAQDAGGARTLDPGDMVANTLGVFLGWSLNRTPAGRVLARLDARLAEMVHR